MGFWSKLFGKKQTKPEVEEWIDDDPEVPETPAVKTTTPKPATKAKATKPAVTKTAPGKVAKDLNPQCAALTAKGDQCKRSARDGSKYCGSHKNYKPKTAAKQTDAKDTKPTVAKAKDTKPATRKAAPKKANAQCAAVTASGSQCKSASRDGSKYCGRHKGYRAPAKAAAKAPAKKPAAKKPAAKKAPAKTAAKKPAAKAPAKKAAAKTQVSEGDYKLFQNGNRFYFSKQTQAEAKKKGGEPVYKLPAGRKVVKTANGLPVLKKA